MKENFLKLPPVQKLCVAIMALSIPVFTVLYLVSFQRYGAVYRGGLLFPTAQGEQTVYSGRTQGARSVFTVSPGPTVEYRRGSRAYGPYTIVEDPTALPAQSTRDDLGTFTGIELREGDTPIFRGGLQYEFPHSLISSDDDWLGTVSRLYSNYPISYDSADSFAPGVNEILLFACGPELNRRGVGQLFFYGLLFAVAGSAVTIYADELFQWRISRAVRNSCGAEPSDRELAGRTGGAVCFTVFTLFFHIVGLCTIV